jgi:signal transduction histidine kinase
VFHWPSLRLQTKLTLVSFFFVAVLVAIFVSVAIKAYEIEERRAFELRATSLVSLLAESIVNVFYEAGRLDRMRLLLLNVLQQPYVMYADAYDQEGKILADGTEENRGFNMVPGDPFHGTAVRANALTLQYKNRAFLARGNALDVAQPLFLTGGRAGNAKAATSERIGGVRIGFALAQVQDRIGQFRRAAVLFGIGLALVGGLLSAFVGRWFVRPIGDLVKGTQQVASGNLDVQIRPSSNDELGLLAASFNQMATSLKQNEAALRRKLVENRTLYEIGQQITAQVSLEPTLKLIVKQARALLRADVSILALRQGESDTFAMTAYEGAVTQPLATIRFRPGEGLGGRAAGGTPVMVGDYLSELRDSPFLDIVKEAGLRSQVAVPLIARGRVIGVLYAMSHVPHQFQNDDQELLTALADHAAIAIENVKLYDAVRQHAHDLEAKVAERTSEIQEANRQLESASRHKSQFLANVSHELRTPLNSIIGFTRLVLRKTEGQIPALQRENLEKVLVSSEHLLNLINGILDLSKIEAGRMEVFPESFRLDEVVRVATATVRPMLGDGAVRLVEEISQDIPPLYTDREKLKQILLNLLSNAVKFTERGEIKVGAWHDHGTVRVAVADTGIGIAREDVDAIFEEFRQGDMSSTRRHGGTGLGLAIAKRFVALLGGDITVESEPGRGSTFAIALPLTLRR